MVQKKTITTVTFLKLIVIGSGIIFLGFLTKGLNKKVLPVENKTFEKLDSIIKKQDTIITNIKKDNEIGKITNEGLVKQLKENKKEVERLEKLNRLLKQQGSTTKLVPRPVKVSSYIEKYKHYAIEAQNEYGIPVSITLAQAIIESNCGTSRLSINNNNHFGIKKGKEYRFYETTEESFIHHASLLFRRYYLNTLNYTAWAYNLQKKGYAENPQYAAILIKTIQTYKLDQIA